MDFLVKVHLLRDAFGLLLFGHQVVKFVFKGVDWDLVPNGEDLFEFELALELHLLEAFEAVALGCRRGVVRVGSIGVALPRLSWALTVAATAVAEASLRAACLLGLAGVRTEALLGERAQVDAEVYPLVALDEAVGHADVHLVGNNLLGPIAKHDAAPSLFKQNWLSTKFVKLTFCLSLIYTSS